uniref:cyclin-dependent kinase inhibitor 1 isoform X2 n=1 Tax=Doryrhamphus excisus TaxID=161450 RepID=UPI0025ADE52A|nr:cyclin-dependent kinase inhibitor 1 isoform X2 [Doryrhamphus excisus]
MCRMMASRKRILSPQGKRPTRRSLFGPVDHNQLQADFQAELGKDLEAASRRWSFDFIADKPLASGDFHWEGVPNTQVPQLYRSCMLGRAEGQTVAEAAFSPKKRWAGPPQCEKENIPENVLERCPFNVEETPGKKDNGGLKRKQTNITDFYQAKRKVVGTPRKSGV